MRLAKIIGGAAAAILLASFVLLPPFGGHVTKSGIPLHEKRFALV